MEEKIKNIYKIIIKLLAWFLWLLILSFILVALYSFIFEKDKIAIDKYNFEQLEKVKPILESIPVNDKKFYSLKEFNQKYNSDIKTIKNCYYISTYNWDFPYIFWFQLESSIYIYIYRTKLFAYPKYDLPFVPLYYSGWPWDRNRSWFNYIIWYPCKD